MRLLGPFGAALSASLLIGASGPVLPASEPLELSAKRAVAEARVADAQVAKLQKAADQARTEAERIGARRAAAAQAISAAEARISAADANARVIAAQIEPLLKLPGKLHRGESIALFVQEHRGRTGSCGRHWSAFAEFSELGRPGDALQVALDQLGFRRSPDFPTRDDVELQPALSYGRRRGSFRRSSAR